MGVVETAGTAVGTAGQLGQLGQLGAPVEKLASWQAFQVVEGACQDC